MVNARKGKLLIPMWLSLKEYKDLIHALEVNDSEKVKDIMFEVYIRKDIE